MDLKTYLETHGVSQEQFASALGVSQGLVWQWLDGRTRITAERVRSVVLASGGRVTPHDLRPDLYPAGFEFPSSAQEAA